MEFLHHTHDQTLHIFHLQNGISSQLKNEEHMSDPEAIFPFWCPGPASSEVQVTAAVWGTDQAASPTSETGMISVSLKHWWANSVKAAEGDESRIQQNHGVCQSYPTTWPSSSTGMQPQKGSAQPLGGLFWFSVVNSFLLLVIAHCVVLKRPVTRECTKSVRVLDKQISIATAGGISPYHEALCCLQQPIFNPNCFLLRKEQEILKHTRLE